MGEQDSTEKGHDHPLADNITGLGQKIIGGIEEIGGILTGDPNTAAEGEFNLEVGEVREGAEEDLEETREGREEQS
jgi:uncharacterized protein YjbJ (UPF0337 family)